MVVAVLSALLLSACATRPTGPSVMAMPGSTKTFDQFRLDDMDCRSYASEQTGGRDGDSVSSDSGVT